MMLFVCILGKGEVDEWHKLAGIPWDLCLRPRAVLHQAIQYKGTYKSWLVLQKSRSELELSNCFPFREDNCPTGEINLTETTILRPLQNK